MLNSHVSTFVLVLMAGSAGSALPAFAACTTTGTTVDCPASNTGPFIAPTGVTGLTVNVDSGATIIGTSQTVAGTNPQYSAIQVNDGSTVNIAATGEIQPTLPASQSRDYVGVNLNGNNTTLVNDGTISVTNPATATGSAGYRVYGVISSSATSADFSGVQVTNNGTISVSTSGTGVARGVYSGENIRDMTIDNFGTISATRTNANAAPSNSNAVGGVDSDDDTDTLTVNNHQGALITSSGAQSFGIGGRAADYTIQNDGTITNTGGRAAIFVFGGDSDDGTAASVTIDNSTTGQINGDVSITDAGFSTTAPTLTDQTRDSAITNEGTINGNFVYASGTHTLDNTGTITGSINVNQGTTVGVGGASFTLTNEGSLGGTTGNIAITDRTDSVNSITLTGTGFNATGNVTTTGHGSNSLTLDGVESIGTVSGFNSLDLMRSNVASSGGVSLVANAQIDTTIFGAGGTNAAPTTNLGSVQGTLTLAGSTNITPIFTGIAHDGDVYALATTVTGAGATTPGDITADSTALVTVTPTVDAGRLLLTVAVESPSAISGLSTPARQTLGGLLDYSGDNAGVQALGAAVENFTNVADVKAAATALSPVVNGADVQAPINATMIFHQQIDTRLDQFMYAQIPSSGRSADLGVARPVPVYGALPTSGSWIEGIGGGVSQGAVNGVAGYNANFAGLVGGYDRLIAPGLRVGVAGGFVDTRVNDQANLSGSHDDIETYQGLAYAEFAQSTYYVRGSVGYGGVDYKGDRQVAFNGFSDTASSSHRGNILTVRGEAGLPYEVAGNLLIPYAAFTYGHLTQDAYAETSNAGAGLSFGGVTNDSERSEVGGKVVVPLTAVPIFSTFFPPATSSVALEGRAAYVHEFGNVGQTVTAAFAGGDSFVVSGPTPSRDMLDFGVGLGMGAGPVQIDLSYNGVTRSAFYEQYGLLRLRYAF